MKVILDRQLTLHSRRSSGPGHCSYRVLAGAMLLVVLVPVVCGLCQRALDIVLFVQDGSVKIGATNKGRSYAALITS